MYTMDKFNINSEKIMRVICSSLDYSGGEGVDETSAPTVRKKFHRYLPLKNGKVANDSSHRTFRRYTR